MKSVVPSTRGFTFRAELIREFLTAATYCGFDAKFTTTVLGGFIVTWPKAKEVSISK